MIFFSLWCKIDTISRRQILRVKVDVGYMDTHTEEQRHKNMQAVKSKDTAIELLLRKELWSRGIRYRKNVKSMVGKPDIAFIKKKVAVFCDSEFFHGKDWEILKPQLEHGKNGEFWIKKISRNRERDDEVNKQLLFLGWTVIRFWGKDIIKNTDECVKVVEEVIFDNMLAQNSVPEYWPEEEK